MVESVNNNSVSTVSVAEKNQKVKRTYVAGNFEGPLDLLIHLIDKNKVDIYDIPIVEITNPWTSYGTGTMFFHNGKYYMSYGLHTERYRSAKPKIEASFNQGKGEFEHITFEEVYKKALKNK